MGSFVTIEDDKVDVEVMSTGDWMRYMRDYADTMKDKLDTAILNLSAVVGTFDPKKTIPDINVPGFDGPTFPDAPNRAPLELDDGWPDTFPVAPDFMDYGVMDFEYTTPVVPAEIDGNFDWTASTYTSEMWTALFAKVHGDILDGGTGLTDAVHSAIVSREQEARRSNQDRAYRKGLDAVGADGFNLSSGQISAFQADITKEIIAKDQDALNNITIKDFDLATENTRFAVTTGADLEKLLRATFEAAEQRGFEVAKAVKDYLIAVYSENVKLYLAKWEGVKAQLEALKTKIDGIARYNEGKMQIFVGQATVYETQIKSITAKNSGLIEDRKGEAQIYSIEVAGISTQYSALVEEMKVLLEGSRMETMAAIEESKIDLEAYTSQSLLAEKVAAEIANVTAQSVASSLGGINTSLSNSYSASESRSEGWSHGESLSESHTYEEA